MKKAVPISLALTGLALAACNPRGDLHEAAAPSNPATPPATVAQAAPPPNPAQPAVATSPSPTVSRDALSDSVITARIKAAILSDPGMTGTDVSVNTDRGVVNLTGAIKSQEQAAIASAHAQRQDGVMRVDNQLAVNLH